MIEGRFLNISFHSSVVPYLKSLIVHAKGLSFLFYFYVFGYTRSSLQHMGSLVVECGI